MNLSPGTRLGPYEVEAPIGAGGMGEVYRARDTRLERSVAVKVLPAEFASRADLRARFEREARIISSLNHPHICALYDVGDNYLVMELLEGETLADRLSKGPLPTDQLLRTAIEIADALDKAHRRGIIHRDLKPANVMLTKSGAKLLDFGLAKGGGQPISPVLHEVTDLATEARPLTEEGKIVGTFQYMAPEQLEGRTADARTDLFAFGALLYEMATGKRAFSGTSRASLIAAVLDSEPPPISQLRPMTPPALDRLVLTCLAKDPDDRWQTAHDVMLELRWIQESGSHAGVSVQLVRRRIVRERAAWALAAVALIAAMAFAAGYVRRSPKAPQPVHLTIQTPPGTSLFPFDERGLAISPDGSRVAFVATSEDGKQLLYVRALESDVPQPLAGTENAAYPFWSPDGRFIGFFSGGKLNKIPLAGGPAVVLCDAPSGRGGTWNREDVILFEPTFRSPLFKVAAAGGTPQQVTNFSSAAQDRHRWPLFLPDGNHFLYVHGNALEAGSLDSKTTTKLLDDSTNAVFAPPDRLVFARGGDMWMQRFDPRTQRLAGEAAALPFGRVACWLPKDLALISASETGALAFLPPLNSLSTLVWFDRSGRKLSTVGEVDDYSDAALSPDGKNVAVVKRVGIQGDIWLLDLVQNRWSRVTFQPGEYQSICWSADSRQIAFRYPFNGIGQIFVKTLGDNSEPKRLTTLEEWSVPFAYAPDGRSIIFARQMPDTGFDLYVLPVQGGAQPVPYLRAPFAEGRAAFSPDGKWVAYQSNEFGRHEIFIRPYPGPGERFQVSNVGGVSPAWRADGREIYYLSGETLMAVPIDAASKTPGTAAPLFRVPNVLVTFIGETVGTPRALTGVSADGQRFLFRSGVTSDIPPIHVVLNWQAALRER